MYTNKITYVQVHIQNYIHMYTYKITYVHVHIQNICTCTHTKLYVHVHIQNYICTCTHTKLHAHVHTHFVFQKKNLQNYMMYMTVIVTFTSNF